MVALLPILHHAEEKSPKTTRVVVRLARMDWTDFGGIDSGAVRSGMTGKSTAEQHTWTREPTFQYIPHGMA